MHLKQKAYSFTTEDLFWGAQKTNNNEIPVKAGTGVAVTW